MKVGLTDEKKTELGEMPRRTATKVRIGQVTSKGSQENSFERLIYLVKVEESLLEELYCNVEKS